MVKTKNTNADKPARYWIATIPAESHWIRALRNNLRYYRGQLEVGASGYHHWQVLLCFNAPVRITQAKSVCTDQSHVEPTRSVAAKKYVWKDDTAIVETRFEDGEYAVARQSKTDWQLVKQAAQDGSLESIPPDIYVRCFHQLRSIQTAHLKPVGVQRSVVVYWGPTGTGKSRTAWEQAGNEAYPKDPRSKFWDGYQSHVNVVMDEYRGAIDISHLLRWFDRYPVLVEIKGSSVVLSAERIWITSNLHPDSWYPDIDPLTLAALKRRLVITEFAIPV